MLTETYDEECFIEEQRPGYVRYWHKGLDLRWEVFGTCAATTIGPCSVGSVEGDIGPPEGRLDVPHMPYTSCSLCVDGGFLICRVLSGKAP